MATRNESIRPTLPVNLLDPTVDREAGERPVSFDRPLWLGVPLECALVYFEAERSRRATRQQVREAVECDAALRSLRQCDRDSLLDAAEAVRERTEIVGVQRRLVWRDCVVGADRVHRPVEDPLP